MIGILLFEKILYITLKNPSLIGSLCTCSYTNKCFGVTPNSSLNDLVPVSIGETMSGKSEMLV